VTLIITAVNEDQAIQVSDRRLSRPGEDPDVINKATFFTCRDAAVSVAFTGLATIEDFNASRWIIDALAECGGVDHLLETTLLGVRKRLSDVIWQLPVADPRRRALSFHVAGFVDRADPPLAFAAVLSNVDHDATKEPAAIPTREFGLQTFVEKRPAVGPQRLLLSGGVKAAIHPDDLEDLANALLDRLPAEALVARAIALVRRAAQRPAARDLIGRDCMSIVVPRDGSMANTNYHPDTRDPVSYAPNFVRSVGDGRADVAIMDFQASELDDQGRPVPRGVPKVGRNKPCPLRLGQEVQEVPRRDGELPRTSHQRGTGRSR
jgi:hypothetical protein